jgi:hypothetical protein
MKNRIYQIGLLAGCCLLTLQGVGQVGFNETGAAADPSAMLDISSTTKGLLLPRMTSAQRLAIAGGTPANGMMVWQTSAPAGIWYYDANIPGWTNAFVGSQPWELQGNTGTNAATQFLGTTNNVPLIFRTNATEVARFTNVGRMGINTVGPVEVLEVDGGIKVTNTAAANTEGAIQWDAVNSFHEGNVDGTATGWYPLENVFQEENPAQWVEVVSSCTTPPLGYVQIGAGTTQTFGTIEAPYAGGWEDHKVQFLWRLADLQNAGICPNEDITALAFNNIVFGSVYPLDNFSIGMLQTAATDLSAGFEAGTVNLFSANGFQATPGWQQFTFTTPFQWNGSANIVVEVSHDNCDWSNNEHVAADATSYDALYGMYCDACGGSGYNTCTGGCATCPNSPCGCSPLGGPDFDNSTSTITCDGCGSWIGGKGPNNKRAQIRFYAQTGGSVVNYYNDRLLWYTGGLVIQENPGWSAGGGPFPLQPFNYRGPGSIAAENSVWGGGTLLNDYVFDIYFDGKPRPEDVNRTQEYNMMAIDEMVNYVELERHLPTIEGREEWNKSGEFSLDKLSNQLWVTVEEQALYIKELNERMKLLQEHLIEKKLQELE